MTKAPVEERPGLPIRTERLSLRKLTMSDLGSIVHLCQQSKTGDWFPGWNMDETKARAFLEWQIRKYKTWDVAHDVVPLAIVQSDTDAFIGHGGIGKHEVLLETEVFIGIEKRYRNMGYATEAVNALTGWAFSTFDIRSCALRFWWRT